MRRLPTPANGTAAHWSAPWAPRRGFVHFDRHPRVGPAAGYDGSTGRRGSRAMIAQYSDHAANERTFLAWIRTAIAVIALGFIIEKFNLFMLTLANAALGEAQRSQSARLLGRIGRYDGLVLICGGLALVLLATVRFVRTARLLDDAQVHSA